MFPDNQASAGAQLTEMQSNSPQYISVATKSFTKSHLSSHPLIMVLFVKPYLTVMMQSNITGGNLSCSAENKLLYDTFIIRSHTKHLVSYTQNCENRELSLVTYCGSHCTYLLFSHGFSSHVCTMYWYSKVTHFLTFC